MNDYPSKIIKEIEPLGIFDDAEFNDQRLNKRGNLMMEEMGNNPGQAFPKLFCSSGQTKAAYSYISNVKVTYEEITKCICRATVRGLIDHAVILMIQDTTTLSFPALECFEDELGYVNDSNKVCGIFVHSTLAVTASGIVLGPTSLSIDTRDAKPDTETKVYRKIPIEEKESRKWPDAIRYSNQLISEELPVNERPRIIHIADREADVLETFQEFTAAGDGAVIRCMHNRVVGKTQEGNERLFEKLGGSPLLGVLKLEIPAGPGRKARIAKLEVRSCVAEFFRRIPRSDKVSCSIVEIKEYDAPEGAEPIVWRLWTTEPCGNVEECRQVMELYTKRWRIEEYHRVLKGGCRIEKARLKKFKRMQKLVALYCNIAARVVRLRDISRVTPDAPCTIILAEPQWRALSIKFLKRKYNPKSSPPTVKQATLWIGSLGGHLNRKGDGMPGIKTIWQGIRDLDILTEMYLIMTDIAET